MIRTILILLAFIGCSAGVMTRAVAAEGGGVRQAVADGRTLSFEVPTGLCPVDPRQGGGIARLWQAFTPPPQRNAKLLALDLDCATVRDAEAGRVHRPVMMAQLVDSPASAETSGTLDAALDVLEERFGALSRQRGQAVPQRDRYAVFVEQREASEQSKPALVGISAYTVLAGKPLIFTLIDFQGEAAIADLRAGAAKVVAGLHASSR